MIHPKSIVCSDVELRGDITINANTIIQSRATILAITGPIVIGSNCIIEEATSIVNRRKETMRIGDDNLIEIGSRVESSSVGDGNTFGTKCKVHHAIRVGSHCVIAPGTVVMPVPYTSEEEVTDVMEAETLPDFTVVFGPSAQRRIWSGRGKAQELDLRRKHLDYLREFVPRFNRMRRQDGT